MTIERIYDSLLPKVKSWVIANSGSEADARDVFQEGLETILLRIEKIESSFEGLVMTICKRKWIDRLRKTKRTVSLKPILASEVDVDLTETEVAYNKYILMEKYFLQLSETCQQVMKLIRQGINVAEIVKRLSFTNANTLYRRKAACMQRWSQLIKTDSSYANLYE